MHFVMHFVIHLEQLLALVALVVLAAALLAGHSGQEVQ
jgi:hypothetical protein